MRNLEIYFSDLTPEAQERALAAAGIENASDANWDIFPIATIEFEEEVECEVEAGLIEFIDGGEVHWA